jgi:hypothetical protein
MSDDITSHLKVIDAAENLFIAYGMGWDLDGTKEVMSEALTEYQNTDHSQNTRSRDVKLCELAIMCGTELYFNITKNMGQTQTDSAAKQFDHALKAIEHLRTPDNAPTGP